MLEPKPSNVTSRSGIDPVVGQPGVQTVSNQSSSQSLPEEARIGSTTMIVGQGLDGGFAGGPGQPRLTRWRAAFYRSRPLDVLTHIVYWPAGANLLGALAVILPLIVLLMTLTTGDGAPDPVRRRVSMFGWAMALVLGDGALRWGQPRGGRIRRWLSPIQGACCVFIPCWLLGGAMLALNAWGAWFVLFHEK